MSGAAEPVVNAGMWWLTLGLGLVITLVVALLLHLVLGSARRIRATVARIWIVGPMIARNTAQVDILRHVSRVAGDILGSAGEIERHTTHILEHASGCAGCPRCVTGWS